MTADNTLYVIFTITAAAIFTSEGRHHEAETVPSHELPSVHCQRVQLRHAAVPTFIHCLTVWSVEPVMTHHTSQHKSIGECEKRQHEAGEVSAPTRASCPAFGSLGQMMWALGQVLPSMCSPWKTKLLTCCPKTVSFTLQNQATHLLP